MRGARAVAVLAMAAAGNFTIVAAGLMGGYRLNMTPSVPLGLWRIETIRRPVRVGDIVFACPQPGGLSGQALSRGYIQRGLCPGGFAPLIKPVAALPGQAVEIDREVIIDGTRLASSAIRRFDGQGRPMQPWSGGRVPFGTLFLQSSFEGSYDSRYFGPIPAEGLLGFARPVLTLPR